MTTATDNTFELDPPRRPSLDDCGGATKENDPTDRPNPVTMPTAEEWNLFAKLIQAYGATLPVARIWVTVTAGTPAVFAVSSLRTTLIVADLSISDDGVGLSTITWDADTFPTSVMPPRAHMLAAPSGATAWFEPIATLVTNGVTVATRQNSGALHDGSYVVEIY